MPITDYASLVDQAARWAGGSSDEKFAAAVADSVGMAESDLNDLLRVPEMVKRAIFTATGPYEALPSDLAKLISICNVIDGIDQPLNPVSDSAIVQYASGYRGAPLWFALLGPQVRIVPAPTPTSPMQGRMVYYGNVIPLTAAAPCTAILQRYPNVYLYGCLKHLAHYTEDDARQAKWSTLQLLEIRKANRAGMLRDATLAS